MKLISHRGNISGRIESLENNPDYIDKAIENGYDVEIDIWCINNVLYLGHDKAQYEITIEWIRYRITNLWIHCKNIDALLYLQNHEDVGQYTNYFWHQNDDITLTSFNIIWTYPNKQLSNNSVCVLPELYNQEVPNFVYGVCSDYIANYKL